MTAALASALMDIWAGWRDYRELWLTVGWYDIAKRYRRSLLGPFWITVSIGVFVAALSFLYVPLLGRKAPTYTPYLAAGLICWRLISETVTESCNVFVSNGSVIQQLQAPLSIYIYTMIWRNVLMLFHNMALYLLIVVLFSMKPTWATLLFIPGLVLVCFCAVWVGLLLGTLCTRFRDIPPIVGTIVQMMFLLTPILWSVDQIPSRRWIAMVNPFYYFLELLRAPLLGNAPAPIIWIVAIAITLGLALLAIPLFARFRNRVAYWL